MKSKIALFALIAILMASCASKKVARAYEDGKNEGKDIAKNEGLVKMNQIMDSMASLKETVIHDTVTRVINVGGPEKKPTDVPTKDYVFKADFKPTNFIGYPELGGKFYRVSPIYTDSVKHYDQAAKKFFYKKTERTLTIYIPIDDYNAIKRKKGNVTIYASWMKLSDTEMLDFESKKEGMPVLAGTNYTDVGVKIDFKPATVQKDPDKKTEPDKRVKTDPKKVADTNSSPCPNAPDCAILGKTLNVETCNCD
jgi:hypothetical protein